MSLPFDTHSRLIDNLEQTLTEMLEVETDDRRLEVARLDLPEPDPDDDLEAQKGARVRGKSYTKPVKATLRLIEGRETIDEATVNILDLPQVTVRGTYVVGGNEYAFPLQKRLIPGVYTRRKDDGDISAWINTGKGRNFKVTLRDKHDDFVIEMGAKKINLLAALRGLGVRDAQLRKLWGTEVFNTNKQARGADKPTKALKKLYAELHYGDDDEIDPDDEAALKDWVLNYFDQKTELDSENVQLTMGQGSDKVSIPLILQISRKVLEVRRGDEDEDNRESLVHNDIYDLSDFAIERLENRQYKYKIERTLKRNLGRFDKVSEIVSKKLFQDPLDSTFTKTSLARIPKQNNPMDMMANFTEITSRGEGGIESRHAITNDARAVDPSHLNFIDPMHTPEGQNIGTTLHLARGVKKEGKTLKKSVWDVRSHKETELTPREFYRAPVAFAEYYDREQETVVPDDDNKVKVTLRGNIKRVPPGQVTYAIKTTTDMFGANSLGVPFLSHNNGTRGMTAAKMQAQAKSLKHREAPKVQATLDENTDETIEERMGAANTPKSPVDGTVSKVARDHVIIKDKAGKPHKVKLPTDFWLNDGNYQDSEPLVKKGDEVKKGQPIADSNYTRDGKLALGVNLKTAYTPYKGLNHEDGLVVSESGSEKLTSNHAHQKTISVHDNEVIDKEKYTAYFPSLYTRQQLEKLDKDGVVKKGTELKKGDPLVVKMRGVEQDTLSKQLKNISQLLTRDFRDTSVNWDKPAVGTVAEVHHRADDILVVVKTEEKARVGDKLVGRYGNKGTITSIVPDEDMPKDEDGTPMQLLLNPNGVVSRMNMGQIMETTASNIANHDGDTYRAKPFSVDHTDEIMKELKERGLKDHGSLYDPTEDRTIDGVLIGDHYTLKLEHKVDKKMSARGAGPEESYSLSGQPSSGKGKGGRAVGLGEMYALLAHGADANLSEMYTFKGDKSFEHWRSIENGTTLPPPEMPKSSRRFVSMLRGMGINLEEDDNRMTKMVPFLDRDVRDVSNGEIKEALALRGKDLKSEEGGLFDYDLTGGLEGDQWTHIELAEPMPHPTFEKSIKDVTGLKGKEFDAIMAGDKGVIKDKVVGADKPGAKVGGEAIKRMLGNIDPDARLEEIKERAKKVSGSRLNKLHREARVLKNFRDNEIDLEEMVVDTVPVIPPKFRPVVELPNGDLNVADVNEHYRSTLMMNNQLKMLGERKGLKKQSDKVRKSLYDGMSGAMGMSMGLVDKPDVKGLAETIAGNEPKRGYYQRRLLKRRQEVSGTGVVSPNPELDMDEIGIPEEMAWKTFKPFAKKELRSQGLTPLKAEDEIKERSKLAKDALLASMEDRHVLANRAPTLHKFSFMAHKPKLVPGHAIQLPVEVLGGYNADFDGDSVLGNITIINQKKQKTLDIKNFPRIEGSKRTDGSIDYYDVPDGVQVYGYDHESNQIRPFDVSTFSVHRDLEMVEVSYKTRRSVEASKDHSLYCISPETMQLVKTKPEEAMGRLTPRPRTLGLPDPVDEVPWHDVVESNRTTPLSTEAMPLDKLSGYFWGAMVGDGYASTAGRTKNGWIVGFCNTDDGIHERVRNFIRRSGCASGSEHESDHEFDGSKCFSKKAHYSFSNLGHWVGEWIGQGSKNKHLPPFWAFGDEDFRLSVLAGLLDTDGSVSISNGKSKPQPMASYATSSEVLADEVSLLCASLGIRANITENNKREKNEYVVTISTPDLQVYADRIDLAHPENAEAMAFLAEYTHSNTFSSDDVVPMSPKLAEQMRRSLGAPRDASKEHRCAYQQLHKSKERGYTTRQSAKKWMNSGLFEDMTADVEDTHLLLRFIELVEAENIIWDRVVDVEPVEGTHTAYDMTVPGCKVFMMANGLIVWDTFGIHVAASDEANKEAEKMLPSQNLYQSGRAREQMNPQLSHEYVLGLFKLTREGSRTGRRFSTEKAALDAAEDEEIEWIDVIRISGIGETTAGRLLAMQSVPEDLRDYNVRLDKRKIGEFLTKVEKEASTDAFKRVMKQWKHLGRKYAYTSGSSFLLSDLQTFKSDRGKWYAEADRQAQQVKQDTDLDEDTKKKKLVEIYGHVDKKVKEQSSNIGDNAAGKSNNIKDMVDAGARGNPDQVKQLVGALGLLLNHRQETMEEPVRGNYAEGLDSSEYFSHLYSQRKGMIDKSQGVAGPGYLSKELTNPATEYKVTQTDCKTNQGRQEKVDRHLLDRALAKPAAGLSAGAIIDPQALEQLKSANIPQVTVRSVLTCEADTGICAKCFGLDEHGDLPQVGKNLGVSEVQALTERTTQLPMKSFHCIHRGGIVFVKSPDGELLAPTHEELFHMVECGVSAHGPDFEEKYPQGWKIWDSGYWTDLKKVGRHIRNRPMVSIRSKSGQVFVCQDNHPMVIKQLDIACPSCQNGQPHVEGQGAIGAYLVRCDHCGHRWNLDKATWKSNKPAIVEAGDVEVGDVLEFDVSVLENRTHTGWKGGLPPYILGTFLAEGSYSRRKEPEPERGSRAIRKTTRRGGHAITNMTIYQNPGEIHERIMLECLLEGVDTTSSGRTIRINDADLARRMVGKTGRLSDSKRFPMRFLTQATRQQMADALCGLLDGDGTLTPSGDRHSAHYTLYTVSHALAQQVHLICHMLGVFSKVSLTPERELSNHQGYAIRIYPHQDDTHIFKGAEKKTKWSSSRRFHESSRYNTGVASVDPVMDENEHWVYDVTTSSGTFVGGGIWNHNTGGVASAETGLSNAFDRASQIFHMPENITGKAVLSTRSGTVTQIRDSGYGGKIVAVAGKDHKVPAKLELKVEQGDSVKKGDPLSEGIVKPQELLGLRDINAVQTQLRDDLHETFSGAGVSLQKRNYEMTVKTLTDQVRVRDPGDCNDFVPGDHTTLSKVKGWNQRNPGKAQIKYTSVLPGAQQAPQKSDDWARRMGLSRIKQTLEEGAGQGFKSDRSGPAPFADLALGPGAPIVAPGDEAFGV